MGSNAPKGANAVRVAVARFSVVDRPFITRNIPSSARRLKGRTSTYAVTRAAARSQAAIGMKTVARCRQTITVSSKIR